jgi:hypothetical protein
MLDKLYRYTLNFKKPFQVIYRKSLVQCMSSVNITFPSTNQGCTKIIKGGDKREKWVLVDASPNWEAYVPIKLTIKGNMPMSRPGNRVGTT